MKTLLKQPPMRRNQEVVASFASSSLPLSARYFAKRSANSTPPDCSVIRPLSHLFSNSSSLTRFSNALALSVMSFADFSRACSRCFFFTRKRADAAVFLLRLSSSASTLARSVGTRAGSRRSSFLLRPDEVVLCGVKSPPSIEKSASLGVDVERCRGLNWKSSAWTS